MMIMSTKKPLSFGPGDVVVTKRGRKEDIICEATSGDGNIEYSLVHGGAWYEHKDLDFVRRADEESMAALFKMLEEERDD